MPTRRLDGFLGHLRAAAELHGAGGPSDTQLLEAFLARKDEDAFAALVRRHGPMVWGVCRRVAGHVQDAEDAFQATFLVLVRKAAAVVPRALVGNWLHGVALRTALKARTESARRRAKERPMEGVAEPAAAGQDLGPDLQRLLDQELDRLPAKYRVAVVLCDLEGKTHKQAARQLGWPVGTLSTRLARARRLLAGRLARHGLAPAAGAFAAALAAGPAPAGVPAPLLSSTIRAATRLAAGRAAAGVVSARVAALTEGVLRAMLLTKLKTLTTVLLLGLVLGLGGLGTALLGRPTLAAGRDGTGNGKEPATRARTDLEQLQGTWALASGERFGEKLSRQALRKVMREDYAFFLYSLTFTGHELITAEIHWKYGKETVVDSTSGVKLDPAKKPKEIHLNRFFYDPLFYEVEGDTLKLLLGQRPAGDRLAGTGANRLLLVFRRQDREPKARSDAGQPPVKGPAAGGVARVEGATLGTLRLRRAGGEDRYLEVEWGEGAKAGTFRLRFDPWIEGLWQAAEAEKPGGLGRLLGEPRWVLAGVDPARRSLKVFLDTPGSYTGGRTPNDPGNWLAWHGGSPLFLNLVVAEKAVVRLDGREGKLTDLKPAMRLSLALGAGSSVTRLDARTPAPDFLLRSITTADTGNSIAVAFRKDSSTEALTLAVARGARVTVGGQAAAFADLRPGMGLWIATEGLVVRRIDALRLPQAGPPERSRRPPDGGKPHDAGGRARDGADEMADLWLNHAGQPRARDPANRTAIDVVDGVLEKVDAQGRTITAVLGPSVLVDNDSGEIKVWAARRQRLENLYVDDHARIERAGKEIGLSQLKRGMRVTLAVTTNLTGLVVVGIRTADPAGKRDEDRPAGRAR
jgi:RNA polymerase sigma-70 factor (ECF subfamily)